MPESLQRKHWRLKSSSLSTGQKSGIAEADEWSKVFSERSFPRLSRNSESGRRGCSVHSTARWCRTVRHGPFNYSGKMVEAAVTLRFVESISKAEQLIKGDGLEINEVTIKDPSSRVDLTNPRHMCLR